MSQPWLCLGTGGCLPEPGPWLRCRGLPEPERWSRGRQSRRGSRDIWAQAVTEGVAWQPEQQGRGWHLLMVLVAEPLQSPESTEENYHHSTPEIPSYLFLVGLIKIRGNWNSDSLRCFSSHPMTSVNYESSLNEKWNIFKIKDQPAAFNSDYALNF